MFARAAGHTAEARIAAEAAAARLEKIAAKLGRPEEREAYLYSIEAHAKTLELAHRLAS